MPKKMGINSKSEEARTRKAAAQSEKKEKEERDKEERLWKEMEGPKSKASKKKEEDAERRAEAAAKRAEAKRLAEQEAKELDAYGKRVEKHSGRVSIPVPKVTAAELARQKEQEQQRLQVQAEAFKRRGSRMADEEEYEKIVAVENVNRDDDVIEAHSVDTALAQMVINSDVAPDRHPERRLKASYKVWPHQPLIF
ncbi:hypothetical protein O6H91_Y558000 [Diphasiastrum complanatum]|nr:hypothetical protein O6H91_Y558000 [Diphasiastrum complanatum]